MNIQHALPHEMPYTANPILSELAQAVSSVLLLIHGYFYKEKNRWPPHYCDDTKCYNNARHSTSLPFLFVSYTINRSLDR